VSEPLELNGVHPGDPCWVLDPDRNAAPDFVQAAVLVRVGLNVKVLHGGILYGALDVFRHEEDALRQARQSAAFNAGYHRGKLADAERLLAELGAADATAGEG